MDEIDLIRRYRVRSGPQPGDAEQQQQHARQRLMGAVTDERAAHLRSGWLNSGMRRSLAVTAALLLLPGGYAIADVTGLVGGKEMDAQPVTEETCGQSPEINAETPGSLKPSAPLQVAPGTPGFSCKDLVPSTNPEAPPGALQLP